MYCGQKNHRLYSSIVLLVEFFLMFGRMWLPNFFSPFLLHLSVDIWFAFSAVRDHCSKLPIFDIKTWIQKRDTSMNNCSNVNFFSSILFNIQLCAIVVLPSVPSADHFVYLFVCLFFYLCLSHFPIMSFNSIYYALFSLSFHNIGFLSCVEEKHRLEMI